VAELIIRFAEPVTSASICSASGGEIRLACFSLSAVHHVLNNDDGTVNDQSEIDRTKAHQVARIPNRFIIE